ncbi:MAG: hypothetical protein ACK4YU_05495 [Paracoccus sp. (in: a-proteobacteria)]
MTRAILKQFSTIKGALLTGDAARAQQGLDDLVGQLAQAGLDEAGRRALEPGLAELRVLAEASLRGAKQATEDFRALVLAAQSLQTYDSAGRRQSALTTAPQPHRY